MISIPTQRLRPLGRALLPHWAHDGGVPALIQRLKEPTQKLKDETGEEMENRGGPASILVSSTHGYHPEWEGKTVEQLSQEFQMDPVDTVIQVWSSATVQ